MSEIRVDSIVSTTEGGTVALAGISSEAIKLQTPRTISLSGDVVGSTSFDGSQNVLIAATIQPNSVALGGDTTGNYVSSVTNGSYITGGDGGSEGATLTLAVDATSANTASKVVARDASGNFSAGTITANLTGTATTATNLTNAANITTGTIDDARLPDLITSNININSGISTFATVKATTFEGALTGTATSTTNIPNLTGDVTSVNTTTTLATVNSNVGTYGSSTAIPSITVNAKGLVTGVTTNAITVGDGTLTLATSGTGLSGSQTFSANQNGNATFTVTSNATSDNTNSTLVARNGAGGFSAGIVTATEFSTGSGTLGISTNTISGPATITIDPAAVGDNTGTIVIKGDLQIDGTTTTVNSTTITVDDKNITLASGAINDASADGGGITIESGDGNKTWNWVDSTDSWTSSENINVLTGKTYKIAGTDVLTSSTLGSGVVNSSLTSVGTLGNLNVSGVTTTSTLNVGTGGTVITTTSSGLVGIGTTNPTSKLHVIGDTRVTGILTVGTASITLNGTSNTINVGSGVTLNGSTGVIQATNFSGTQLDISNGWFNIPAPTETVTLEVGSRVLEIPDEGASTPTRFIINDGFIAVGGGDLTLFSSYSAFKAVSALFGKEATYKITSVNSTTSGTLDINIQKVSGDNLIGYENLDTTSLSITFGSLTTTPNKVNIGVGGTILYTDANNGFIGIGSTNPTSKLHVVGNARVTGVLTATTFSGNLANTLTLNTSGTGLSGSTTFNNSGAATFTVTSNATSANTASAIVARDASGNFSAGTITATTFSGSGASLTGIPISGLTASTTTALGVGSIELGHETDTTISRAAAGRIAVEGVNVVTVSSTDTLTNKTLTSPIISSISNTGTLTLPTSTDTLVGRTTTDTLTNKTISSGVLSGTLSIGGTTGTNGQVLQSTGTGVTWAAASSGGGSGEFNIGISSSVQITPLAYETTAFTFPSTAGKRYIIESMNVSNVAVGDTEVNIIASITPVGAAETAYIAYNVPISSGGAIELLKEPIVANPSDAIKVWATNYSFVGTSTGTQMYMNYTEQSSTTYFSTEASTVSIATTDLTTVYTSTTYPSVIQSIHLANRTDSGDYPISVAITNGVTTTYLVKDLIVPRYSAIELLERPKRIEAGGTVQVKVEQTSTIDVIVSGRQIV